MEALEEFGVSVGVQTDGLFFQILETFFGHDEQLESYAMSDLGNSRMSLPLLDNQA